MATNEGFLLPENTFQPVWEADHAIDHFLHTALSMPGILKLSRVVDCRIRDRDDETHLLVTTAGIHEGVTMAAITGGNSGHERSTVVVVHRRKRLISTNGVVDDLHRKDKAVEGDTSWRRERM